MENALKLVGSLGWPHAALIFGVFFVLLFRKQIQEFILKIKKVGKEGVSTETNPAAQVEEDKEKSFQEIMELGDSPFILEAEAAFRKKFEAKGLEMEGKTAKALLRFLTVTQIALDFEQAHSVIFGSQIYLLKKLNEVTGQGLDQNFLDKHLESIKNLFPKLSEWDIQKYLHFLFSRNLLTNQSGNYHITVKGVEFLVWLAKTGHSENRPL